MRVSQTTESAHETELEGGPRCSPENGHGAGATLVLRGATLVCTCLAILSLPFGGNFQKMENLENLENLGNLENLENLGNLVKLGNLTSY